MTGTSVSTSRSMLLCACGASIGLGIAGYGLFTAAGTSTRNVAPENVATVNQRPILRSDFVTQLEMETGRRFGDTSRAEQLKLLDDMVREEMLVQRGLELDFAETDQGARNALVAAISEQILAEITTSEATDAQLERYFEAHRGQWATEGVMTLRHFVLADESQANLALTALERGDALDATIARAGARELPRQEGEYYFTVKYRLGDLLFAAIRGLAAGEWSAAVPAKDGVHIVQMLENQKPVPLDFKAARSQVLSDFNDAEQSRIMGNTIKFLRDRSKVLIAPDYAGDYRP